MAWASAGAASSAGGLAPAALVRGGAALARGAAAGGGFRGLAAGAASAAAMKQVSPETASNLGFDVVEEAWVEEYASACTLYRHRGTGAELMSVANTDENKSFGTVLRTPPKDSKGIPHILEHSVLCGSRKYPIKEPFVELMKSSLNTFLNAFTYPDRTCYPVASTNLRDFYNLVDVYLDAVYHPRCVADEMTLQQEGWHYELDEVDAEPVFKGVVFNEMKGVYSNPESVLARTTQQALFPDTTYGVDSGGTPEVITDLSFEEFSTFHADYYHPSNSRFWFYGDDEPEERLRVLGAFLDEFSARPVDSSVGLQALFTDPKKVRDTFAAGETTGDKGFSTVNWVLSRDSFDNQSKLAWGFLDFLMLGTRAAPLFKALTESGLGEAVTGGGLEDELRQPVFGIGLKGVSQENMAAVEALVLKELARMADEGFPQSQIEAAINTIEFSLRENNTGSFPRGVSLMLLSMSTWLYDKNPIEPMRWESDLRTLKTRLESGEDVFGDLIRETLLNNPHRVTVELLPDTGLAAKQEADERAKLERAFTGMSATDKEDMVKNTAALRKHQETPDSPEDLQCVPSLSLDDIPKEVQRIPSEESALGATTVLKHDIFTNGVLYADLALDMGGVPGELLPLIPLFCRCLTEMGTETESFVELTERIGRKTGGLAATTLVSAKRGSEEPVAYVMLRGKAMQDKSADLFDIARDVLTHGRLDDQQRFLQMVLETKAGQESSIVAGGHSYAARRLSAQHTTAGWVSEQMGGLDNLQYIRALEKRAKEDWPSVLRDLESIRSALVRREGSIVNLTGDAETLEAASPAVEGFLGCLEDAPPAGGRRAGWLSGIPKENEALVVPTQVNYVGKGANLYRQAGYDLEGSAYVISKYLGNTWLWDRVRVSGGAYGGFCSFDNHSGMFTYLSYRDPNLKDTVANYDGAVEYLRTLEIEGDALQKAIISTIGEIDSYQLPDAKGYTAFQRHVIGISDEQRQKSRDEILSTTQEDFRRFAEFLETVKGPAGRVVAVASKESVERSQAAGGPDLNVTTVL